MRASLPLDARIGIVGAGCAGLSAAEALRELGYRRITLLEARDRVGGKTVSATTEGASGQPVVYEGGTVWAIPSPCVDRLAARHGLRTDRLPRRPPLRYLDLRDDARVSHPFRVRLRERRSPIRRALELARYLAAMAKFRRDDASGLSEEQCRSPAMTGSIEDWFAAHGLQFPFEALFPVVGNTLTGGLAPGVPAIYYLKILALLHRFPLKTLLRLDLPHHAEGNAELWRRIARTHDVRLGAVVRGLERGEILRVHTSAETHAFDRVIWTAPLDRFAAIADCGPGERDIFARVRHFSRSVLTARVRGLPPAIMLQLLGIPGDNPAALPYSLYEVHPGSGIYNFYSYLRYPHEDRNRATVDDARRGVQELVARLGGELLEVRKVHVWDRFFPHFGGDDLRAGVHSRLAALQGRGGLYLAGELLAHITVPLGAEFAALLVRRHFAADA